MSQLMSPEAIAAARSLCEVFQATVAARGDAVALRSSDGCIEITWREYGNRVRGIAAGLAALGVRRGDTVGMMLTNRPEFHLVDAAVMHLGATAFSVYSAFTPEQVAHLFANAANRIVICERQFVEKIRQVAKLGSVDRIVSVDGTEGSDEQVVDLGHVVAMGAADFDFDATWRRVTRDDLLTLIFTSGTTGPPKGVELTHGNLLFSVSSRADFQREIGGPDTTGDVLSYLPDANLANRFSAHYVPMATGARVTDIRDGRTTLEVFKKVRPVTYMGVPMIWYKLKLMIEGVVGTAGSPTREQADWAFSVGMQRVRHLLDRRPIPEELAAEYARADQAVLAPLRRHFGLDNLSYATSGGAPIAPAVLEFFMALGLRLCEVYGMTEGAAAGLGNHPDRIRCGTVGQARPGIEIKLAADGELLLRSPGVMRGYRNEPEKTAEAVDADGWLHTGDIATIDADGYVTIVDRKKDMIINSSGKNLAPANIENAIKLACPLIGSIVAIGDGRPHVVALLTLDPEQAASFAEAHDVSDRSANSLAHNPLVKAAIADGISRGNDRLSRVEQVRAYSLLPMFWEVNSDELTATTKVRRSLVLKKYAAEIDALYAG